MRTTDVRPTRTKPQRLTPDITHRDRPQTVSSVRAVFVFRIAVNAVLQGFQNKNPEGGCKIGHACTFYARSTIIDGRVWRHETPLIDPPNEMRQADSRQRGFMLECAPESGLKAHARSVAGQ